MSMFDAKLHESLPDYDLNEIDRHAGALEPQQRFSQAREAEKLEPVIKTLLAAHPGARASAIADMLAAARRDGGEALGATFRREVSAIVCAIRTAAKSTTGPSGHKKAPRRAAQRSDPVAAPDRPAPSSTAAPPSAPAEAMQTMPTHVAPPAMGSSSPPPDERPYRFTGRFDGKVFTHGSELRTFFSAIEKGLPPQRIAELVAPVLANPTARARLGDLAPADRAIFESMQRWAKAHVG